MCKKNFQTIINEIDKHLETSGKRYFNEFFIGISKDAASDLFNKHYVKQDENWWIYRTAETHEIAQEIKEYYAEKGMRNNPDEAKDDENAIQVYCYAVTPITTERIWD